MKTKKQGNKKNAAAATSKKSQKPAAPRATAPAAAATKPAAQPKRTIKQVVIEAIAKNPLVSNEEMIKAVLKEFPKSAFKDTHAAWYRSQARKGALTGTPIEIRPMARKQKAA